MKVEYSYFGVPMPSLTHVKQEVELPTGGTVDQLMDVINEIIQDKTGELLSKATFLVNKTGAKRDTILNEGDEIIIMYPIGGG